VGFGVVGFSVTIQHIATQGLFEESTYIEMHHRIRINKQDGVVGINVRIVKNVQLVHRCVYRTARIGNGHISDRRMQYIATGVNHRFIAYNQHIAGPTAVKESFD
jgi:hypothetical protein